MEDIDIDIESLRRDLMNYFGAASQLFPVAYMEVIEVEEASDDELIQIALRNGFNLLDYEIYTLNKD